MTFLVILRRELQRLILLPQTYAVAAAFLVISGIFFINTIIAVQAPDLGTYYSNIAATLIVLAPIVAMRSFAEDRMTGAHQLTMSWPLSRAGIVLAKFVVNTLFLWVLVSVAWLYVQLLSELAPVDVPRAAGGYIGTLLLCAAFSALALMVSAFATTTTAAAFLGFGLLLFLWTLQYAPGWIHWLHRLGPDEHLSAMSQGVVYGADVAYFVIVALVGLGLATFALDRASPGPRRARAARGTLAGATTVVVLIAMPLGIDAVGGEIDITHEQRNTISDMTREVLAAIDGPIKLTGYLQTFSHEEAELANIVKSYRAAGADISATTVDPDIRPGVAEEAGVTSAGVYRLELAGRSTLLTSISEIDLTTAISQLSRARPPKICFTYGHGERRIDDTGPGGVSRLADVLYSIGYRPEHLALGSAGGSDHLAACDALAVLGPQAGFLDEELAMIRGYLEGGGRVVVAADGATAGLSQLNALVQDWGLRFDTRGTVNDLSSIADDSASIVTSRYSSGHPVVADLVGNSIPLVMPFSLPIELAADAGDDPDGPYVSSLVGSSDHSWLRAPDSTRLQDGAFTLAAYADATRVEGAGSNATQSGARIVLVGSTHVATNRYADVMGDQQFASGVVQWASQENDLVAAHRPAGSVHKLLLTSSQKSTLIRRGLVLPVLAVLAFAPLLLLRLRRG